MLSASLGSHVVSAFSSAALVALRQAASAWKPFLSVILSTRLLSNLPHGSAAYGNTPYWNGAFLVGAGSVSLLRNWSHHSWAAGIAVAGSACAVTTEERTRTIARASFMPQP